MGDFADARYVVTHEGTQQIDADDKGEKRSLWVAELSEEARIGRQSTKHARVVYRRKIRVSFSSQILLSAEREWKKTHIREGRSPWSTSRRWHC